MTPKILVIGDVMLDKFIRGEVKRLSPEAPVPVLLAQSESAHLGGGANVAANACALGAEVSLIGVIGKDAPAQGVVAALDASGIEWLGFEVEGGITTTKTRLCSSSHSGHHLLRLDREGHSSEHSSKMDAHLPAVAIKGFDSVIICDYRKGVVTQGVVDYVEKNFEGRVFYDMKPRSPAPFKDWVWKMNHAETIEAFGEVSPVDCTGECLITHGKDGATVFELRSAGSITHRHPALCKSPVDVSGAGDTTMAAYAVARTQGKSIPEALEFASKAAAVAVSQPGTAVVRLEDVMQGHNNEQKH